MIPLVTCAMIRCRLQWLQSSENGGELLHEHERKSPRTELHPRGADFQKIAMPSTRSLAVLALGKPHPGARRA